MVGEGELIEQRRGNYLVGGAQMREVLDQSVGVARNINNIVKTLRQAAGVRVHACARRIDKNCREIVIIQIDVGEAIKRPHLIHGLSKFFR